MNWYDDLPQWEQDELRDAGRIGATRYEQMEMFPPSEFCDCPGPANGYPSFHLPICPLREAEPFA